MMRTRISLVNCLLLFIVGWIGGLLLIQYIFETPTGQTLRHSFTSYDLPNSGVTKFINSMGKVLADYSLVESVRSTSPLRKSRYLPNYQPYNISVNRSQTTEQHIHILLDWPVDDRLFTVDNYKALESLLNVYPTATFRCILPTSRDAYVHKISNTLSINQFLKYEKKNPSDIIEIHNRPESLLYLIKKKSKGKIKKKSKIVPQNRPAGPNSVFTGIIII